jgi:hypothetical protein
MSKDWQPIDDKTPKAGTLLRLWCRGVGPNPKPFECDGWHTGGGWAKVVDGRVKGMIFPGKWKPLTQ